MAGMKIYFSNRQEKLFDALADIVKVPLSSPLQSEIIVCENQGTARWLCMKLSQRFGVWANYEFPFAYNILWRIMEEAVPDIKKAEDSVFNPQVMKWKIMRLITQGKMFKEIEDYLKNDSTGLKRYQLAKNLAEIYDKYMDFRPDWILEWEQKKGTYKDTWQAKLWYAITCDEKDKRHRAFLMGEFLKKGNIEIKNLPRRISVFGLCSMPPVHLEVFKKLSEYIQVSLFVVTPCCKISPIVDSEDSWKDQTAFETGNSLLSSMGQLNMNFLKVIKNIFRETDQVNLFVSPGEKTLLQNIQTDILNSWHGEKSPPRIAVDPEDRSVQIHSCYLPMREVEVLYDNLLKMLEKDKFLEPKDIVVMTPDIEMYAPFIQAVFGAPEKENMSIPYCIADISLRRRSKIAETLINIFKLAESRFEAVAVLSILESPYVQRKFQIDEKGFETIYRWIQEAKIYWGTNDEFRKNLGLPETKENTWEFGLDRMFMGYAMHSDKNALVNNILPFDSIEGGESILLGEIARYLNCL
ncbi:MAG: exodeoxyribonuclease V subunit gamma, partial [Elusimicrobiota bacterium]